MQEFDGFTREQLIALVFALRDQLKQVTAQNAALESRVAQLEGRGGDPPVSPGPVGRSVPEWVKANRSKKAAPARKKRRFAYVRRRLKPTRTVVHAPETCPDCNRKLSGGTLHHTREVIDLPPVDVEVVEHQFLSRWCGVCRKRVLARPDLSELASGKSRIGNRLTSLIAHLHTVSRMPLRVLRDLLRQHYRLEISLGEIAAVLHRVARAGEPIIAAFISRIRGSPVVHADETGYRENGINGFMWSFSTRDTRYYMRDPSRGSKVPKSVLGAEFHGRLVSDFYSAYSYYLGERQRCWVHLLRYLKELKERNASNAGVAAFVGSVR